ncbi:ShlB/FhaC/HecB family hemolysin secretion/activation protein [Psychromonas sp. Urea-02u-13]|uniref:ShlB/FhaC/HecB family hemolysin secretion/activation protein n=1 Tax=Psychromonas sp. Urea-02u-13 TaxID=2058326 RepID=UPI000C329308|nr:ShlB/FhaC/HecB family hemolysin secretion/activation protein [Psychromonas sp. Urea-02u-13]PKG37373.1 hemolysin activator protein, HlyB family [Psychromonas sp. Urea-02u-13]
MFSWKKAISIILLSLLSSIVQADFLKMPEIEQLRKIKEKTLLQDMDIPAVRERSLDPNSGPRLAVAEFRIQGLVEFPELGITREAIAQLVESIRFDLMGEGKLLESGYTINELGELSDLLIDIEEETVDRHVSPLEVQKLVWLIRAQQGKRGVTLGQIEGVANSITQFYRKRGFILAKAYIPKQEVRDGVVNLTVLLGILGEINVHGNALYDDDEISSVFGNYLDKPVTSESIEENLFIINGYPGINVDGYFEPGTQVGDTKLNVSVRQEERFSFNTRVDNHGSKESGLYRFLIGGQANNLFGFADYLNVSLLQTVLPEDTTFWQINYESNFFSPRLRVAVDISQNQFLVDQSSIAANIDLSGVVDVYGVQGTYISQRSRKQNSSYLLRYENISSDLQIGDLPDIDNYLDERLSRLALSYRFDLLDDTNKLLHEVNIGYNYGFFDYGFSVGQKEKFHVLMVDYTLLSFFKVPLTDSNSRVVFRSYSQYAGTNLSSLSRFSLTGPTKVRGFSSSYFTADDAIYLGTDWIFNSPSLFDFSIAGADFSNSFKPFVFFDYAYGYQHLLDLQNTYATAHLADVGLGLKVSHRSGFDGTVQLAFPILSELEVAGEDSDYDSMLITFDFQYVF